MLLFPKRTLRHQGVSSDRSSRALEFLGKQDFWAELLWSPTAVLVPSLCWCLGACTGNNCLCGSLHTQVDLRRQWISQIVEEVQKVIHHLTTEISTRDIRFQAVPYSGTYNGNIKVSRSHASLSASPREPGNRVSGSRYVSGAHLTKSTSHTSCFHRYS